MLTFRATASRSDRELVNDAGGAREVEGDLGVGTDVALDRRVRDIAFDFGEGADGAVDGAGGDVGAGRRKTLLIARELGLEAGEI